MNPLSRFLRHYLLALQFFTRIPVTGPLAEWVGFSPDMLRASAGHFPGVGWLVGGLLAGLSWLLLLLLPETPLAPLVVAVLGTAAGVLLTGAFHEDGLADVADGLGGALGADILGLDPSFPLKFMVYFLIVCAVGGTSSITGPLVAALVLGIADVMGKYYMPKLGAFIVYVLMIAILLWRPQGLFSREGKK